MMARAARIAALTIGACLAASDPAIAETPPAAPVADARPAGQRLYGVHCLSCHQSDGGGVPNMQPAIAGGSWVQGDARALALFVMSGGFDSGSRKESDSGNVMPPFRQLTDADLAEILSYIRQRFGNGASAVSAADVAEARRSLPAAP
jgi:mono/diheme cytochrome c family protein